jgi:hypothetical protein
MTDTSSNLHILPSNILSSKGLSKEHEWEVRWFYTILQKINTTDKPILNSYRIESMVFLWSSILYLGCTYEKKIYDSFLRDLDKLGEVAESSLYLDLRVFRMKFEAFITRLSPER